MNRLYRNKYKVDQTKDKDSFFSDLYQICYNQICILRAASKHTANNAVKGETGHLGLELFLLII